MNFKNQFILLLFGAIFVRILYIFFNPDNSILFQQDEYGYYAESILSGHVQSTTFSEYSKRLMPGYPLLMIALLPFVGSLLISGFVISFLASVGSVLLLYKITKNIYAAWLYALFPPIWLEQSVKITTEPVTAFLLLLGIQLYTIKRFFITGFIIGIAFDIRIISVFLLIALLYLELHKRKFSNIVRIFLGFSIPIFFLLIYNYFVFGSQNILEQFVHGDRYGGVNIGFIQLYMDILRTIDWGQYRILFSGLSYIVISFIGLYFLFKYRNRSKIYNILFYWAIFSTIFVFSASPFTFIENYSRYSLPYFSAIIFGLFLCQENLYKIKFFKRIKRVLLRFD